MSVWTGWDPLEEVIVGDCYAPNDLDWALPKDSQEYFNQILKETKEDLDYLSKYLTDMGVIVFRPDIVKFKEKINLHNFQILNPTAPIVPRDQYLVYGDTIYQTYTSMPDRYIDSLNYYSIFKQKFDQGYNWISLPPPSITNLETNTRWWADGSSIYSNLSDRLLWHTATMFKCGDKIIVNNKGPGTSAGLKWIEKNTPDAKFLYNTDSIARGWGHIDHGFFMTDDNTVFCADASWVPSCLQDKKIIEIGKYFQKIGMEKLIEDYKSTPGQFSKEWLDLWLSEWKGYAQQINFDTNVLVVDPNNVIFSHCQPELFEFLKTLNITAHVCPQRHGLFWESGIHCLTLDIKRKGNKRSIIKC